MKRVALILSIIVLSSFYTGPSLIRGNAVTEYLNEINTARQDPYAYGKKYGIGKIKGTQKIDKKDFPPNAPVQLDSEFTKYAEERALEIATKGKLAHTRTMKIRGKWVVESLAFSTDFEDTNHAFCLIEDKGWENLGHRGHLLYSTKLIGIGIAKGKNGIYSCVISY